MHYKTNHQRFDLWEQIGPLEFEPLKYLVTAGVVVVLVLAWVLTGPLFQLSDRLAEHFKKSKTKNNKPQNRNYYE